MQKLDNYTKSLLESFSDKVFCAVVETITIILMLLLSIFVGVSSTFATKSVNTISGEVTISPSLNVTIPSSTVSLNLNPLNTDFDSSNLNVTISTNNPSGYTLTMSPVVANTTSLTRVSGTETIPTLIEKTGGYTESEFTTNSWGYKLASTNYLTFKNTNDITTTNTPSNNDTSIVTFAAKADNTQAAGTYQLEITFTAIANPLPEPTTTPGKITYNPNSGTVIGQMGTQSATDGNTVTLYAPNFKNPGYGFAGWNTEADGSGDKLGPNEDYLVPPGTTANGLTLYAMWIPSAGIMQGWTGCSSLQPGTVTALTDNRDGDTYAIAKLADNKCWMIENLRLDDSAELSNTNTNNPSLPLTNIYDLGMTSNHLSPTSSVAYDAETAPEGWCSDNSDVCFDQSRLRTDNTTFFINNTASNYSKSGSVYSYGNYYNWYSATAGNGKHSSPGYSNMSGDICPIGWHLPAGGNKSRKESSDFWKLSALLIGSDPAGNAVVYSGDPDGYNASRTLRAYPNNFVYSGSSVVKISNRGAHGNYYSATSYVSSTAYGFSVVYNILYPGSSGVNKGYGYTLRCMANG